MKKTIISLCIYLCAASVALAQVPLCLGDNYYQKRMVKVFDALNEHKLDKAAKYWQDIEEKAAKDDDIDHMVPISKQLYPVWQLSEAVMMNTRDGRGKLTGIVPFNPWSAYTELKKICSNPSDKEILDLFLAHKDLKMQLKDIKSSMEKNLIDSIRGVNTEDAYDQLMLLLFDYDDMTVLEDERELIAYNSTKHAALDECQRYIDKYGERNTNHHFTIEWRRDSLAFESLGKTAAACQAYLNAYPKSRFNSTVQERLHLYAFNELEQTVEACQQYVKLYPESEFNDSVNSLEKKFAFRDAKSQNNIGSYRQFLTSYPESPYEEEALQLLQESVMKRYFNPQVPLVELRHFLSSVDELTGVDKSRINSLYYNLLFMPTSALMNGCDGLLGKVVLSTSTDFNENTEVMIFNDQGLMVRHYNAATGIDDRYSYGFDPDNGFVLLSKTQKNGHVVKYVTKWNDEGDLLEVAGSDGSVMAYSRDFDYLKKVVQYNGKTPVRTDYYDVDFRIGKSVRSGNITVTYRYNSEGDLEAFFKKRGKAVTDSTTYEFGYVEHDGIGKLWQWRNQYNNDKKEVTKYRKFNKTIDKVTCDTYNVYEVDWFAQPVKADTVALASLIAELDNYVRSVEQAAQEPKVQENVATIDVLPEKPAPHQTSAPEKESVTHEPQVSSIASTPPAAEPELPATSIASDDNTPIGKLLRSMVLVEGGTFIMGATSEQDDDAWELEFPAHQVRVSSFYMSMYEVTQELWNHVMGVNPSSNQGKNYPVEMVSWDDCQRFIEKLNDMTGMKFRLPTEAEWEYAARGGKKGNGNKYAGSNELDGVAWYSLNATGTTHSVGNKLPNELGLYDMSGNVWEWCEDWQNFYSDDIQSNPIGNYPSNGRVQRGGCWKQGDNLCRVSFRGVCAPGQRNDDSGLRLVVNSLKK